MGWRGVLKGVAVAVLLMSSVIGLWYGVIMVVSGGGWRFAIGVTLFIVSFRAVILAFDWMWGRPPFFSKRPWERPWEHDQSSR